MPVWIHFYLSLLSVFSCTRILFIARRKIKIHFKNVKYINQIIQNKLYLNNILFNMFEDNLKIKDVKLAIGQLVKSYRKREKLSMQELGDELQLSRITIQNVELGKNFTIETLLKVLQYFELLPAFNSFLKGMRSENEGVESLY